jgi:hypothetical protein
MRRGIVFVGGVILLTIWARSMLWAEAPSDVTCGIWTSASADERLMYAVGYSVGATYAAATVAANYGPRLERPELAREILMYLLPENYRFGAIASEIDTWCRSTAADDKLIVTVLEDIAREKNAAVIDRYENQEYQQFFQKMK